MVGLFKAVLATLLLATLSAAQSPNAFNITDPTSELWWVAKSTNVLSWDCQSQQASDINNFTVLISNINPAIFPAALAIIAIQQNFQCSITISQDQADQPAGTGNILLFANPLNNTDVYTTSEQFEIKPLGSLYPSQVSSSASAASGTAAASASASAGSNKNGAHGLHNPGFLGLTGIMGLLIAGLMGA